MTSYNTTLTIREQVKIILKKETSIDQNRLIEKVNANEQEILREIKHLLNEGKIAYNIDYEIDGRGKEYATGIIYEDNAKKYPYF